MLMLLAVRAIPFALAQQNVTKQSLAKLGNALPTAVFHRTLTFAERVSYQRGIEEVYWRHRIWPNTNAGPKPPLDAVMSQAQLEGKVEEYLRNSQALEDYWQRPLTEEQLQAEMDRMAQRTKQPELLRELFAALGNDPFVIAECLARPVLAERLANGDAVAAEPALSASRTGAPPAPAVIATPLRGITRNVPQARGYSERPMTTAAVSANYTLPAIASPSGGCIDDTWTATSTSNAPERRRGHTAVWTGSEMIVWGGGNDAHSFNTGGRYDPSTDSWTFTSTTNAPTARSGHTAVWTGSEMIVWGPVNTGGRYNPITNSWTATSTTNAPVSRASHTAVWTGSEMIIWGGCGGGWCTNSDLLNTGGRYNPITDSWTATTTTNAPAGRWRHTAVWTGTQMIAWGGCRNYTGHCGNCCDDLLNTGGRYNPSSDSWTATITTNAPTGRILHTAVWTDSEMIVWGGRGFVEHNTGGRYNPGTDSWTATTTTNAPSARDQHTAVWTDSEMIVWGGYDGSYLNTGRRYNPITDSWIPTSLINRPSYRYAHTAVWTDGESEMIIWGGDTNTGGSYCAQPAPTGTPSPTPTPTACTWIKRLPVPYNASGIFTVSDGTYIYAGGGYDGTTEHSDLLRYDPATNSWTSLAPSADTHYMSQAVLYSGKIYNVGGFTGNWPTNITRIYDIATNTWTTGAAMPVALSDMATMLWNGIIYVAGGYNGTAAVNTLYAYNIATDSWSMLAPMERALFLPGFGAINGKLYVASGGDVVSDFNTLYIYDIASNTWTIGAVVPTAVLGAGSTVYCGKLCLYGGGYPISLAITQIYDPVSNTWSSGPNLNFNRLWFYGSAVDDTTIVAPGGDIFPGSPVNVNEELAACICPLPTATPTPTQTPTPTASGTATATATATASTTATATPVATPRVTPTPRPRPTAAPRP
jgi:N-acetylneuraminic acid mutarotase